MAHGRLGFVLSRWRARGRTLPLVVTMTLAAGMTGGALVLTAVPAAAAAVTGGAGASLAYTELQAESASTNGTVIGPSYTQGQLADEASGRRAVTLTGQGRYVEFTLPSAANSIVVRYSIPDTADGSVYSAKLSLYVNGTKQPDLTLTNAYSWFYGGYPFTNSPGSNPHHFYDEVHALLPQMPAGAKVRLQVDAGDAASSYTIDLADGEQVNGIGGALANSTVSNIWIEHTKVGAWMDGPFDGLTFSGMRIRDTTADGINFHDGITHSSVTQS